MAVDRIPVEAFLSDYRAAIRDATGTLCALARSAVPHAVKRVRPGWLIGYDVPPAAGPGTSPTSRLSRSTSRRRRSSSRFAWRRGLP